MEEFKPTPCVVCLVIVSDENCRVIEDTTKDILDIILLKLSVEVNISVMCNTCHAKVFEAFGFKATCIDTEDIIFSYVNSGYGPPADLKKIYLKERDNENLQVMFRDERICRLCLQLVTSGFTSINDLEIDLIRIYIPEINFNFSEDPIICALCMESLKTHCSFLKNCVDVQKAASVVKREGKLNIKLEEIEIKSEESEKMYCETLLPPDEPAKMKACDRDTTDLESDCKQQLLPHELLCKNGSLISLYKCDSCDFATEHKQSLKRHKVIHKDVSQIRMYNCVKCSFQSKHKTSIVSHELLHRDGAEVQIYKCDVCNFKTRYKTSLTSHRQRHEDNAREHSYTCEMCKYETKHKRNYIRHQIVHKDFSQVQVYQCDKCLFETKYRGSFLGHQLTHKSASEMQMYKCLSCEFETNQKKYLIRHVLIHRKRWEVHMYKCDRCDYETRYKTDLEGHELRHKDVSEVEMYTCGVCDYETKRKPSLKRHMLTRKHLKCATKLSSRKPQGSGEERRLSQE